MAMERWHAGGLPDAFDELERLQDEVSRLFGLSFYPETQGIFDRNSAPPLDVVETKDGFTVRLDLPGVEMKDIEVSIASNVLTVKGEKKEPGAKSPSGERRYYRREIWTGSFQRTLTLPTSVDPDRANAEFKNGVLVLTIGKRPELRPRQIAVRTE